MVRPISGFPAAGKITEKEEQKEKQDTYSTVDPQKVKFGKVRKEYKSNIMFYFLFLFVFPIFLCLVRQYCSFTCVPLFPPFRLLFPAP